MNSPNWSLGMCSWSMHNNFEQINQLRQSQPFDSIHLDLRPCCCNNNTSFLDEFLKYKIPISSTMIGFSQEDYTTLDTIKVSGGIVPDDSWEMNRKVFKSAIEVTAQLGVPFLSSHIGFIDHKNAAGYQTIKKRVTELADQAQQRQITLLLETGQETATDLTHFLKDINHPSIAVNFDPANMILYGKGNPIEGLKQLAPWIKHIHIKDAVASNVPGTWGNEVAWNTGQVDALQFLTTLKELDYSGTLAVEREAGENRSSDIQSAIKFLSNFINKI